MTHEAGGVESADVGAAVLFAQAAGHRDVGLVLRGEARALTGELFERSDRGIAGEQREPVVQLSSRLLFSDGALALQENVAGVERQHHALHAHPGRLVTGEDRRLNGGRPAVPREERRVDVERGDARDGEDLFVKDLSIARDDEDVRLELCEGGGELTVAR